MRHLVTALGSLLLLACGGAGSSAPASQEATHDDHAAGHPGAEHHPGREHHRGQGHQHGFSDVERYAAIFDADDRDAWQMPEEVVARMGIEPGMTVVDLGAGTGYFLPHLARAVGPTGCVLALDVEPNMVTHMQARIREAGWENVRAAVVDPSEPGLAPHSADRVLTVDTWHHIEGREAYASRLATALSGETPGKLVIVDFTMDSPFGPPASMRLTEDAARAELSAASMSAETVEEPLPHQWIVVGTAPASDAPRAPSPCER
ncbi:MAG: class I SAM-dependent methyltransferase [Sandaracinaceae bacterium]